MNNKKETTPTPVDKAEDMQQESVEENETEQAVSDDTARAEADAVEVDAIIEEVAEEFAEEGKLSQQLTEAQDKFLRLQAEWDNYRKRTAAERLAERERATEKFIEKLLPVVDDLARAIDHAETSTKESFAEGIQAVAAKLSAVLDHEGVESIDPMGQPYDADLHQAVGTVEDSDVPCDTVVQVYQKGYCMGGRVVRPAMVAVSSGGPSRLDGTTDGKKKK
jgi:molecular chaperone GrpE